MSNEAQITLTGNATDDATLRFTPNGVAVANVSIAVTPREKNGDQWVDGQAAFYRVAAWRDMAENVAESVRKGDRALPETELYGNTRAGTIRAVINAHQGTKVGDSVEGPAGHGDHTITLALPKTTDWTDWTTHDGKLMAQADFAEFIEDHLPNFVAPTGADMLELAQTFQATTKVDFASSQRIQSGETQLLYTENQSATAGKKGSLAIPDTFTLALQPFERGEVYKIGARFRYRINGGTLLLGYRLTRPEDTLRHAVDQVIAHITEDTGRTTWHSA